MTKVKTKSIIGYQCAQWAGIPTKGWVCGSRDESRPSQGYGDENGNDSVYDDEATSFNSGDTPSHYNVSLSLKTKNRSRVDAFGALTKILPNLWIGKNAL